MSPSAAALAGVHSCIAQVCFGKFSATTDVQISFVMFGIGLWILDGTVIPRLDGQRGLGVTLRL
jgi:hypothetical protein